jgi:S-adenosylmethionine uptake transporter
MTIAADSQATAPVSAIHIQASNAENSNVSRGIFCMIIATVAFAISHALSKWLVTSYPIGQVMFSRSLIGFAVCAAFLLPIHGTSVFSTERRMAHWMRGLTDAVEKAPF